VKSLCSDFTLNQLRALIFSEFLPEALWKAMGQLSTTELCVVQVARVRCVEDDICNVNVMAKTQTLETAVMEGRPTTTAML
jgi:hypothetical protein